MSLLCSMLTMRAERDLKDNHALPSDGAGGNASWRGDESSMTRRWPSEGHMLDPLGEESGEIG